MSAKLLKISIIILIFISLTELGYYLFIMNQKTTRSADNLNSLQISATPTLALALGGDQSYRTTDAPDRVTRFINTAFYTTLKELSEYNPVKSIDFNINMLIEGKIEAAYDGKKVEEKFPPDPDFPNRTTVAVIEITDSGKANDSKITKILRIVKNELPYLTINDEHDNKLSLSETVGKQARINHIIELPVAKNSDIVTLEPVVHNNVVILDQQ